MNTVSKRLDYLDNLKVVLTAMVVFHHAGLAYFEWSSWIFTTTHPSEMIPWMGRFLGVNSGFFMGLYFFISAYFIPKSYDKQGFLAFIGKKFLRLGVPMVLMGAVISWWRGFVTLEHLWFLENLLTYSLVYAVFRIGKDSMAQKIRSGNFQSSVENPVVSAEQQIRPSSASHVKSALTLLVLVLIAGIISVIAYLVRILYPVGTWRNLFGFLIVEPAHLTQYLALFIFGLIATRRNLLARLPNMAGAVSLMLGAVVACLYYFAEGALYDSMDRYVAIYESFLCVFMCTGLIWLFRQCFHGTSAFLKWCSANAFGAYIVHLPIVVLFQQWLDPFSLGTTGVMKFIIVGILATIISFVLSSALRAIPGVKKVL